MLRLFFSLLCFLMVVKGEKGTTDGVPWYITAQRGHLLLVMGSKQQRLSSKRVHPEDDRAAIDAAVRAAVEEKAAQGAEPMTTAARVTRPLLRRTMQLGSSTRWRTLFSRAHGCATGCSHLMLLRS